MTRVFVFDGLRKAGAQVVTTELCNALAARGEDIAVVTYRTYDELSLDPSIRQIDLNVFGLSKRSKLAKVERAVARACGKLWCFLYSWHCSRLLRKQLNDIANVNDVFLVSDAAFSWFFRIRSSYPTTIIFHSVKSIQYQNHPVNRVLGPWFLRLCSKDTRLLAISVRIKSDLVSYADLPEERIKLVRNFVDHDKIKRCAEDTAEVPFAGAYFVFVGRLSREKRPLEILAAYSDFVAQTVAPPKLVFVGDGPVKKQLEELVDTLGLSGQAVVVGKMQNPYPIIKRAAALVLNSEREGFPTVVLEASILGTPYISSRSFDELDEFACIPKGQSTFDVGDHDGLVAAFSLVHNGGITANNDLRDFAEGAIDDY
jgi:glycosyltransferase involved in cell wall biosynthesis